jgi:hypothetical protein
MAEMNAPRNDIILLVALLLGLEMAIPNENPLDAAPATHSAKPVVAIELPVGTQGVVLEEGAESIRISIPQAQSQVVPERRCGRSDESHHILLALARLSEMA